PRREDRRYAQRLRSRVRRPEGQIPCASASTPCCATHSRRCGGRHDFGGEYGDALFISHRADSTIMPVFQRIGRARLVTDLWARKPVEVLLAEAAHAESGSEVQPLKRALSAINLIGLGI